MSNRIITKYPDNTLKVQVVDTRTTVEQLQNLSFAERLAIQYPADGVDEITKNWEQFDNHKRLK